MIPPALRSATAALALGLAGTGCMTKDPATREDKVPNAVTQGLTGVAGGAFLGAMSAVTNGRNVAQEAVNGAVTVGLNGVLAGFAMDRFEAGLLKEFEAVGVKATPRGLNVVLEIGDGIRFAQNSAAPSAEAARKLRAVGLILARFQRNRIDVIGHTSAEEAAALSGQRAAAVAGFLAQRGVAASRIRREGKGSAEPVRADSSEATRSLNRRVDIFIAPLT
ncbi:hypothetical protein DK419_09635 [Methylobacterium terrae]|uniref:OmpA-like domain-containing protein n=1 Tax=Methylobacterium terrae TaxID=2202827 RepID=A0A2U8WJY7_9HYPH|nr:OmpA family protein [Methylobacterium terrae]AWN46545.1 hypothetical protein DK419_09635 [Methylobacterium terrae]